MDKVAIVTGGGRGIGKATALMAAAAGYDVALSFVQGKDAAEAVARSIEAQGRRAIAVHADSGVAADIVDLFEQSEHRLGPVTALVNNAGIVGPASRIEALTDANLARVLAVNVAGSIIAAREAVRRMSTKNGGRGGAIVNLSSAAARLGAAGEFVHYAASKGAIDSFTIGLAREVAAEGIRVNAVRPGMIDTDIHASSGSPERLARIVPTVPMKRIGTTEEVAQVILWLLSDAASYVTGALIDISGGR